ncbi:NADP(H)-dependent aldo-keto reductase [Parashewanella hymeniacidonis]|uniref:NADP(H)-dependent aldo-keto reductase n=1 Tax=Parashewanella hymeniacidonis TaxID=2807618 RepID=UPI003B8483DE
MKSRLANSSLEVSKLCIGTMTWGEQNTQSEAFSQLDLALEHGINFIDTAELYPVPPKAETQGCTEEILGNYLKSSGNRDKFVLATKVAPQGPAIDYIRPNMALDWNNIHQAVDSSLERLQTDAIDLYQIHWPQRDNNRFGSLNYQAGTQQNTTPIIETLEALADVIKQGKVRYIGISNETPWGMMKYLQLAEKHDLPKIVSIQNPYNLLNRSYEVGLSEISHRENIGLLAYSPLAFGVLTGKYQTKPWPKSSRLALFERFDHRYTSSENANKAVQAYVDLAREFNLAPVHLALAFINQQQFVASTIIGATNLTQLKENIDSADVVLSDEVMSRLEEIGSTYRIPCP